jgi:HEAT repeat protein
MNPRWIIWPAATAVALAGGALLTPRSPLYLPNWWYATGQHNGQSTRFWVKALDSDDQEMRRKAIFALGAIGPEAGVAVPKLAAMMLEDADFIVRGEASLALSKMAPASEPAVPALAQALSDEHPVIRMNAATALFRLREKARAATPTLVKTIKDESNQTNLNAFVVTVQEQMVLTLGRVSAGTDEGVPALTATLNDAVTNSMRRAATRALGFVGPDAKPALPLLTPLADSADDALRAEAREAIRKIEGARPGA